MNKHPESTEPADEQHITLRGPAELADALPYLMGFHPSDSVVMVALHGGLGRFGGRLRLDIPPPRPSGRVSRTNWREAWSRAVSGVPPVPTRSSSSCARTPPRARAPTGSWSV